MIPQRILQKMRLSAGVAGIALICAGVVQAEDKTEAKEIAILTDEQKAELNKLLKELCSSDDKSSAEAAVKIKAMGRPYATNCHGERLRAKIWFCVSGWCRFLEAWAVRFALNVDRDES